MTAPIEPTPGASVDDPTAHTAPDAVQFQADPARTEPAQPAAQTAEDISSLPEWAQKQIRDARAEAAKSRTSAKQTAAEEARQELTAQIARALGFGEDEEVDPSELTDQIEQAQAVAWRNGVELQVYRAAGLLGANPDALLDSMAFIDTLDDLVDEDPRSPEFAAALNTKVQEALARNGSYKATGQAPAATSAPRPDPSQGPRGANPAGRPSSLFDAISQAVSPS